LYIAKLGVDAVYGKLTGLHAVMCDDGGSVDDGGGRRWRAVFHVVSRWKGLRFGTGEPWGGADVRRTALIILDMLKHGLTLDGCLP